MRLSPRSCVVCKATIDQRDGSDDIALTQYFEGMCERHASNFIGAVYSGEDRINHTDEPEHFAVRHIDIYRAREILREASKLGRMTG